MLQQWLHLAGGIPYYLLSFSVIELASAPPQPPGATLVGSAVSSSSVSPIIPPSPVDTTVNKVCTLN